MSNRSHQKICSARVRGRIGNPAWGRLIVALIALVALTAALLARFGAGTTAVHPGGRSVEEAAMVAGDRPNIVFVLTDDLSSDLVRFMPQVRALEARGMTFRDYFVSDSLCCPSRASIFTGNLPHDTGVFTNSGVHGGFNVFHARGEERLAFNVALARDGYRTAMMGKYLNGYLGGPNRSSVPGTYVPPGWDQWDVAGWGYPEYNYELNQDGVVHPYGDRPRDYLTDVLARDGVRFIDNSAQTGKPFFLELATFAPHFPYTPARRDEQDFPGLQALRPPSFDVLPTHAPRWLADHPPLREGQVQQINRAFRRRAQAVQAINDMLAKIEAALTARGMLRDTYIVFSSDNGLHTGEYRLMPGKLTAFDTDIRVPLVIAGPGVPAGKVTSAIAENIDLAKTFAAIGHTTLPSDGHSLLQLLHGRRTPAGWRDAILVEHRGAVTSRADPDVQTRLSGNPTTYEAMRTPRFLYVEYRDGEREFYDLRADPFELHNLAGALTRSQLGRLHTELRALKQCHDGPACWAAEHVPALL